MDSLVHDGTFDGQYHHLTVDPLVSSLQSSEPLPSFPPGVGSPLNDTTLPAHTVPAFPDTITPTAALPVPAEVALPQDPRRMDISPTEVHQPTVHHDTMPPSVSMPAFQSQLREAFPPEQTFEVPRPTQSSPAATSVSSFTSHTSSPAIPGLNPAYATIPPASIASTMDSMGLSGRSRSGSAASPGRFVGGGSDLTFPSVTSTGTPTSNQGSGHRFPTSEYDVSPPTEEELGPDLGAPHMMAVDDMLKKFVSRFFSSFPPIFKTRRIASCKPRTKHASIAVQAKLLMRAPRSIT